MSTTRTIHQIAEKGFNAQTDAYEKGRPGYPEEVFSFLQDHLSAKLPTNWNVIDLACGTGKFSDSLVKYFRFEKPVELHGVEPVDNMRLAYNNWILRTQSVLEQKRIDASVDDGTATEIPACDQWADVIFVGQAFHWFANRDSLEEIHRVLRPGGKLVLVWNLEDNSVPWVEDLRNLYESYEGGVPQYRLGEWINVFKEQEQDQQPLFSSLQREYFYHSTEHSKDTIWQRVVSKSYIASLDQSTQQDVHVKVEQILNKHNLDGMISLPHRTEVAFCTKQ